MARNVFYSFHYHPDAARAAQVRNMGVVDGNKPAADNDWETVTKGGDKAIQNWIDGQMNGRSCAVVLAGANTAGRKWINYEIAKAWNDSKGVVAVHIHNLKDLDGKQSAKGGNPLARVALGPKLLSSIAKAYDPAGQTSTAVYAYIEENLPSWIEEAVKIRNGYKA